MLPGIKSAPIKSCHGFISASYNQFVPNIFDKASAGADMITTVVQKPEAELEVWSRNQRQDCSCSSDHFIKINLFVNILHYAVLFDDFTAHL